MLVIAAEVFHVGACQQRPERLKSPERAGDKIWDKERYNLDDFENGLHKRV
jgi:hypothetical protein